MLFHIFGEENRKTVVMIHGLAMSWDMLKEAIGILAKQYRVIAAAAGYKADSCQGCADNASWKSLKIASGDDLFPGGLFAGGGESYE